MPTPVPSPAPTTARFPQDLLGTSWELDYVVEGGEKQAPYHQGQCLAIGQRPESYYFFDGCNHGYCDTSERRSPGSAGDKRVLCSLTMQLCLQSELTPGPTPEPARWDKPFHDALMGYSHVEVRAGALWVYADKGGTRALVFKRMAAPCAGQNSYLQP